jgi:hypothetical protein
VDTKLSEFVPDKFWRLAISEVVQTYPTVPSPCTVDNKEVSSPDVLMYFRVPRPCVVDVSDELLTYPNIPRPCVVEVSERVLTYLEDPNPLTVELNTELSRSLLTMITHPGIDISATIVT